MEEAKKRAHMPQGSAPILEYRSVEKDYSTLLPLLRPGMHILDVGCGPGAISQGMVDLVGPTGSIVGIDSSEHLIARGKQLFAEVENLELIHVDLFAYQPETSFDLIVSARVLQWLKDPLAALEKMKTMVRPGGYISILDYDHTRLEWKPKPPQSMRAFYGHFLKWRSDAGMNNQMAEDLPELFRQAGLEEVEVIDANETYRKGAANFLPKIGIWTKVAESRGKQLVEDGYLSEAERLQAIEEYEAWIEAESQQMVMKLMEVRGKISSPCNSPSDS